MSTLKTIGSKLWDIKTRLQHTGWLQYVPNGVLALLNLLGALIGWWVGALPWLLFWPPLILGAALGLNLLFDLLILKANVRPNEAIPPRREELDAFDLMRSRRSCRSFQPRTLTEAHRSELMEQVRLRTRAEALLGQAPIRLEYIAAQVKVWPVVNAQELLVAIAPKAYDRVAVIDVGRSLQKVVTHATRMGLATCWIGPGADHQSIIEALGERFDPDRDHIICVCAVGYASRFVPLTIRLMIRGQRNRLPLRELFFASPELDRPLEVSAAPFSRFGRCYEVCQWSPSSFNAQPTRCAAKVEEGALRRFDFFASNASRYYSPVALGIWCANWETGCEALGIPGRFERLSQERSQEQRSQEQRSQEQRSQEQRELPRYDLSWVLEEPMAVG